MINKDPAQAAPRGRASEGPSPKLENTTHDQVRNTCAAQPQVTEARRRAKEMEQTQPPSRDMPSEPAGGLQEAEEEKPSL